MRTHKLLLTSALAVLLLGSAACSTSDDMSGSAVQTEGDAGAAPGDDPERPEDPNNPDDPGIKEEPGSGADDPVKEEPGGGDEAAGAGAGSLAEALAAHGDTERLAREIVADDCGTNDKCLAELDELVVYIEDDCGGAGCSPVIQNFLQTLTSSQRQGVIPSTFPQKRDLVGVAEDAVGVAPPDSGDESKSDDPADDPVAGADADAAKDAAVAALVEDLRSQAAGAGDASAELSWNEIVALIRVEAESDEEARALVNEVKATLERSFASASATAAAKDLLDGGTASPGEAADAVEAAWAEPGTEG